MPRATPWARNALRAHLGASFDSFEHLRTAMLRHTESQNGPALESTLQQLSDQLSLEVTWLKSLDPPPEKYRSSRRAHLLREYGDACVHTMRGLHAGLASHQASTTAGEKPDPDAFEAFGVGLLQVMAHCMNAKRERLWGYG